MIKPTLYALAPHLVNELGHTAIFHEFFFSILAEMTDLPCHYQLLLSKKATLSKLPFPSVKWFRNDGKNFTLFQDYYLLFKQKHPSSRIFFQENFSLKELLFLTLLMILFGKRDSLWLVFRYDFAQLRFRGFFHRICLILLGNRVKQFTDSTLIAKRLKNPILLPICHTPSPCSQELKTNTLIRFWWPGEPRPSKGSQEILHLLQSKDPAKKECILSFSESLELTEGPQLIYRTLPKILAREEYEKELQISDVILLPYYKSNYKSSTSGILVESIVAGKMVVVKEGTWLSYELERFDLKELVVDWKEPYFFTKVLSLLFSEEVQKKRRKMEAAYRGFHNKETFSKVIKKAMDGL